MNRTRTTCCTAAMLAVAVAFGVDAQDTATCDKNHYILDGSANSWIATGNLNVARAGHTATSLPDGKVLVAGGVNRSSTGYVSLDSAELYDPATRSWTFTGSLTRPRAGHTATLLANGKVLVVGGSSGTESGMTAELYDPVTGNWSSTGSLNTSRVAFTTTLLATGKVLVAGGVDVSDQALASAELYDPSTGTWTFTGDLITARFDHTATALLDGKVLVASGLIDDDDLYGPVMTVDAELYDPFTGAWSSASSLKWFRWGHTATRLLDGNVLIAGGSYETVPAELFDPVTGTWQDVGDMKEGTWGHTATLLSDGGVIVVGGGAVARPWPIIAATESYEPATATWMDSGTLNVARSSHTATLLPDGTVLVAGGYASGPLGDVTLRSAELFVGSAYGCQ